ncbi:hypothetical protein V6Z11_D08G144300 [Gossypium hirsutum]
MDNKIGKHDFPQTSAASPSTILCCIAVDSPLLHRRKHLFCINTSPETATQKREKKTTT